MPEQETQAKPLLLTVKAAHFTGIKGVGMAAAALCLTDLGIQVTGSDVEADFVTEPILRQRNLKPQIGFEPSHIPANCDLLVYTGAHQGKNNPEVLEALRRGVPTLSHAELVGQLMQGKYGISVCGVGGKTSISAMIANILDYAGKRPSFLVGVGNILNLQVPGRMSSGDHFIAEADEYVVSPGVDSTPRFIFQDPQIIVCTNIAHDHPDVYPSIDQTKATFMSFFKKIPKDGLLILHGDSAPIRELDLSGMPAVYYGKSSNNDWWVKESFIGEGKQLVTVATKDGEFNITLAVPGLFNAKNALAAYLAARHLGIDHQTIVEGLTLFRGSKRRFEKIGEKDGILFYDDYAHHPTEVLVTLQAARQWLPLSRIVVVFQPHTYSRTKVLLDQFSKSFAFADEVIITDIYASAREAVDPSISGYKLAQAISEHNPETRYVPFEELVANLKTTLKPGDALFTIGAGNIYQIHEELLA